MSRGSPRRKTPDLAVGVWRLGRKQVPGLIGNADRTRSPFEIFPERVDSNCRLETFGKMVAFGAQCAARRLSRSRKSPPIAGPFSGNLAIHLNHRNAWLALQCRSHRSPAKFPANREYCRFSRRAPRSYAETLWPPRDRSISLVEQTGNLIRGAGNSGKDQGICGNQSRSPRAW
jgi:hypothetical protein